MDPSTPSIGGHCPLSNLEYSPRKHFKQELRWWSGYERNSRPRSGSWRLTKKTCWPLTYSVVVNLHIDVYTAMNGCNRFLQLRSDWTYDKTENLLEEELQRYSHLLSSVPVEGFKSLKVIRGFSGLKVNLPRSIEQLRETFPFISIRSDDKIYILVREKATNLSK